MPYEILLHIFKLTGEKGLLNLAGVCQRFHSVAATVMYRRISYVIHHDNSILTQSSLDRFAAKLETVNNSEWEYGAMVKRISVRQIPIFDTSGQTLLVKRPEPGPEVAKFLNTLLTISLQKTTHLNDFNWDIRLELSPSLFRALSELTELTDLHVRLPARRRAGCSDIVLGAMLQTPHYHFTEANLPATLSRNISSGIETEILKELGQARNTQTLSCMSGLKSLSVLDVDDLKVVLELSQCITKCAKSLKSLSLSFSEDLAKRARKKKVPNPADTTTPSIDEGFMVNTQFATQIALEQMGPDGVPSDIPLPLDPAIRRERVLQEMVLPYIFKVCEASRGEKALNTALEYEFRGTFSGYSNLSKESQDKKFVKTLRSLSRVLPKMMVLNSESPGIIQVLDKIDKAATLYLGRRPKPKKKSRSDEKATTGGPVQPAQPTSSEQAFAASNTKKQPCPTDVIDIEYPDESENEGEDQEFLDENPDNELKASVESAELSPDNISKDIKGKQPVVEEIDEEETDELPSINSTIERYVREKHGIPLEHLSIYLIPVSPVALTHAVDMFSLRHLSLLNVGAQGPLWVLLKRFNELRRLQLTSIHTDNVTPAFTSFVNSLDKVTELFLYERSSQTKVEPLAAKSTVDMANIRQDILAKHIRHLHRLMLRNDDTMNWVADARTVQLITTRGIRLIELGLPISTTSLHYMIQQVGGMLSLKALQLFWYRSDMCTTMLRELQCSLVDSIMHFPHLRIEYVAMCFIMHGPVANAAIQVKGRATHLASGAFRFREEKNLNSQEDDDTGAPSLADSVSSDQDGDGDSGLLVGIEVSTRVNLKIEDIRGVRMWEKGCWEIKL
ncbi:hypothetical protein BO71DRAFT_348522 [Aspergillus ellipticus CBS 707.79]|uniref:F-box domain-containing protein n=1 Tax=Aspergillus ellipticus CBS 707.79 TaxID=1448320 RepID=A0A319DGY7_9EURO|nr:hypothetical protein BO71DRAFT_348522 [Aspergillus ellipticus CBS 707.79]